MKEAEKNETKVTRTTELNDVERKELQLKLINFIKSSVFLSGNKNKLKEESIRLEEKLDDLIRYLKNTYTKINNTEFQYPEKNEIKNKIISNVDLILEVEKIKDFGIFKSKNLCKLLIICEILKKKIDIFNKNAIL